MGQGWKGKTANTFTNSDKSERRKKRGKMVPSRDKFIIQPRSTLLAMDGEAVALGIIKGKVREE